VRSPNLWVAFMECNPPYFVFSLANSIYSEHFPISYNAHTKQDKWNLDKANSNLKKRRVLFYSMRHLTKNFQLLLSSICIIFILSFLTTKMFSYYKCMNSYTLKPIRFYDKSTSQIDTILWCITYK